MLIILLLVVANGLFAVRVIAAVGTGRVVGHTGLLRRVTITDV